MDRRSVCAIVAVTVTIALAGCAGRALPSRARIAQDLVTGPRPTRAATEGPVADWRYTEHQLTGSWRVMSHVAGRGLLVRDIRESDRNRNELHLMDIETGKTSLVRDRAVDRDLMILGYGLGERWVAWEEVCEGDLDKDPSVVVWKLYAAPYDPRTLAAGEPHLVDRAVLTARSRPHFAFVGEKLYIACTNQVGSDFNARIGVGEIREVDLASKDASRTLLKTDTPISFMVASEGKLVVTRLRTAKADDPASRVEVYDPVSGKLLKRFDPPRPGIVAHSGAYHDGRFVWAELAPDVMYPAVFLRSAEGSMTALSFEGGDGGLAGAWAVAEATEANTESVSTKSYAPGSQIYVMPLDGGDRSLLVDGLIASGQLWRIAAAPEYHADRLVVYADGSQFEGDGKTRIRVYELPAPADTGGPNG